MSENIDRARATLEVPFEPVQPGLTETIDPDATPDHKQALIDAGAFVEWSPEELSTLYDAYKGPGAKKKVANYLADATLEILNNRGNFLGEFNRPEITSGRAEGLKYIPLPQSEKGKGLSNEQVLRYFTNLKQFGDPGVPTRTEAAASGVLEAGGAMYGGMKGGKYGVQLGSKFLPNPLLGSVVLGTIGFIGGSIIGGLTGDTAGDLTMTQIDPEKPLTPSTESSLKTWGATGSAVPFVLSPLTLPTSNVTMAHLVRNLPSKSKIGPLTKADFENPFIKSYLEGKKLRLPRSVAWAEDLLIKGGRQFDEAGKIGKSGIIAAESLAVPATLGLTSLVTENYGPRREGMIISSEIAAGLAPNLVLLKHLPNLSTALRTYVAEKRATKEATGTYDWLGRQRKVDRKEIQKILGFIEEKGENPEALLAAMEEAFLDENGKIKPQFQTKDKKGRTVTSETLSSDFVESPALTALSNQVLKNMGEMSSVRNKSFEKSMTMQTALIDELRSTGDPELVKIANQIQQSKIELLMQTRMAQALETAIEAVEKIYPEGGEEASELLGLKLFDVIKRQKSIFRSIEGDNWKNVDGRVSRTVFPRIDPDTDQITPDSDSVVPNVVEAWDSIMAEMQEDTSGLISILQERDFKTIDETIRKYKAQLGLSMGSSVFAEPPPAVLAFRKAYSEAEGDAWRDNFDTIIGSADLKTENGVILPTQENIVKIAALVQEQRPNKLLKAYESAVNKLSGKNNVFGQPYSDEAINIERSILNPDNTAATPPSDEPFTPLMEMFGLDQSRRDIARADLGTSGNANLDNVKTPGVRRLNELAEALDAPEGSALRSKEATIAQIRDEIEELRDSSPANDALANGLERLLELDSNRSSQAVSIGIEPQATGTTEAVIEALNQAALGLDQQGSTGKLRKKALDARREYLADMLKKQANEDSGRVEAAAPAGPLAALLNSQKKALIAEQRRLNEAPVSEIVPLAASELIGLRKTLRRMQTKYNGPGGDDNYARLTNDLRSAALDDLMGYGDAGIAYQNAIDSSVAFNQYFKKTFGQDVIQKDSRGRPVVHPELSFDKLFNGRPSATALRLNQIEKLNQQLKEQAENLGASPELIKSIDDNLGTQTDLLNGAFKLLIERNTSAVEEKAALDDLTIKQRQLQNIRDWAFKMQPVIKFFPSVKKSLDNIKDPQNFINEVKDEVARMDLTLKSFEAFKQSNAGRNGISSENPMEIINKIYNSPNPSEQLAMLAKNLNTLPTEEVARKVYSELGREFPENGVITPEQAKEGLLAVTMDYAFSQATKAAGDPKRQLFDAGTLYTLLYTKIPNAARDSQTMAGFLEAQGSLNKSQAKTMKSALERIISLQAQSAATGADLHGIDVPAIYDLYTRIAGARLGQFAGSILPGGRSQGLVEESAGSKYVQQLTQEIPFLQEQHAFQKIMLDPEKLMLALRTPRSDEEKTSIIRTLSNFVKGTGKAAISLKNPLVKETTTRGIGTSIEEVTSEEAEDLPDPLAIREAAEASAARIRAREAAMELKRNPPVRNLAVPSDFLRPSSNELLLNRAQQILNDRQSQATPPVVPPTPRAQAAPPPNQASSSGPVDLRRAQALFPNDTIFRPFAQGGIASLRR